MEHTIKIIYVTNIDLCNLCSVIRSLHPEQNRKLATLMSMFTYKITPTHIHTNKNIDLKSLLQLHMYIQHTRVTHLQEKYTFVT